MKKKTIIIIALTSLLVIGTISVAFSQGFGRRAGRGGQGLGYGPGSAYCEKAELNLTEEQSEKLQSLKTDFAKERIALRSQMQTANLELKELWVADELDEAAITAKTKEVSDLRNEMQGKALAHRLEVAKVLTKEQRSNLALSGNCGLGNGPGPAHARGGRGGRGYGLGMHGMGQRGYGQRGCNSW